MAKVKAVSSSDSSRMMRPALSPEARESQLISLAMDRAEEQLRNGTASSQVITHFLKLATVKAELEKEKMERENELLRAKTEAQKSQQRSDEFYEKVLNAFKQYSGQGDDDEDDEYY